ncbi:MAG: putative toxin-antitoxin system toxin component, PIN family [Nitrospirota bacterium]|nr:putative toxin-antitoxin system toxin component, PIN family [Nitrospirota bacterium]
MMIRVVLDTNQLVSALLNPEGPAFEIVKASGLIGEQKYELVISEEILSEFRRVLSYPRIQKLHKWSKEKIEIFITLLKEIAHIEESHSRQKIVPGDPDDDKFFHIALKSGAQYIISRDAHLLSIKELGGIKVLKPEVFLSALKRGSL